MNTGDKKAAKEQCQRYMKSLKKDDEEHDVVGFVVTGGQQSDGKLVVDVQCVPETKEDEHK